MAPIEPIKERGGMGLLKTTRPLRRRRRSLKDMIIDKRSLSRSFFAAALAFGLSLGVYTGATASESSHPHWAYDGEHGPEHWGHMSGEYAACAGGKSQSPVDIKGYEEKDLPDIAFGYKPSGINIVNNGHTIQVNYDKGSSIKVDGVEYRLAQFHFHDPSEHTVGGKSYAMELHFVHRNDKGDLAVVGVLFESGKENAAYGKVFANMPKKADEKKEIKDTVDAAALLPEVKTYYRYAGSLTTPPCTEGVTWLLLKTPVQLSEAQIKSFKDIFSGNNRPVQPVNDRKITADTVSK